MSRAAPGFPSASREFALLAACCRWPADAAAVRAAADGIDWERFAALVRRHRVLGLAQRALDRAGVAVSAAVAERWALAIKRVAARNLRLLAETARLADLLAGAGVAAAFVKGATLAELAYGDQAFKQSTDIDLIVPVADVRATIAVLQGIGYRLKTPEVDLDPSRLAILTDALKEAAFVSDRRTMVDLHWRLASIPGLIADVDPARDIATVTVDGRALPTLTGQRLLDYLAVHGGRHGWARLKWLADFNALLAGMSGEEIAAFHRGATASGSGVCAGVALLQAHRLLGALLPADLLATILRSRRVRWLAAMGDGLMIGPDELAGQDERRARYWFDTVAGSFLMNGRPRYLAACVWHAWVAPDDALALPLPRPLWPLYAVISPVARTGRGMAKIGRTVRAKTGWSRTADRPMGARQ